MVAIAVCKLLLGKSGPPPMPFGQANAQSKGALEGMLSFKLKNTQPELGNEEKYFK